MLFALLGLGIAEFIILGLMCLVPVIVVAAILAVLQVTKKRPPPRDERPLPDDDPD